MKPRVVFGEKTTRRVREFVDPSSNELSYVILLNVSRVDFEAKRETREVLGDCLHVTLRRVGFKPVLKPNPAITGVGR